MMGLFYFVMFTYILFLAGVIALAAVNIKLDLQIRDWRESLKNEMSGMRNIQIGFEERVRALEVKDED